MTDATRPVYRPHDAPTRRGWLMLGENGGPCDKACRFCYYAYQDDLVFYSLDTVLMIANRFRHAYGLTACDFSGGEPTIYPRLAKVVEHCANIGVIPTIITHGQNNSEDRVRKLEDDGLGDWLISLHGLKEAHESAVINRKGEGAGGWEKTLEGLGHMRRPVRFNTTLQGFNYRGLAELARWLVDNRSPTVWNMIQFNPFHAWNAKGVIDFQVPMEKLGPHVGEAVRVAEAGGFEVNVRYFPFCVAAKYGFARNCVNFYQTQYDPHEWGLEATNRNTREDIAKAGGAESIRRLTCDAVREQRLNPTCESCRYTRICEGPTNQYQKRYGLDELAPEPGEPVTDILHFEKLG